MFRRILSALVALTLIIGMSALAVTPADYSVDTPENLVPEHLYGRGCILINALTGDVLFEKNADDRRYPASTTKIMTCILGIEWARANGVLDEPIVIPNNITVSSDSSKMGLTPGDTMTFTDLLYGMMLGLSVQAEQFHVGRFFPGHPEVGALVYGTVGAVSLRIGTFHIQTLFVTPHIHGVEHLPSCSALRTVSMSAASSRLRIVYRVDSDSSRYGFISFIIL